MTSMPQSLCAQSLRGEGPIPRAGHQESTRVLIGRQITAIHSGAGGFRRLQAQGSRQPFESLSQTHRIVEPTSSLTGFAGKFEQEECRHNLGHSSASHQSCQLIRRVRPQLYTVPVPVDSDPLNVA